MPIFRTRTGVKKISGAGQTLQCEAVILSCSFLCSHEHIDGIPATINAAILSPDTNPSSTFLLLSYGQIQANSKKHLSSHTLPPPLYNAQHATTQTDLLLGTYGKI